MGRKLNKERVGMVFTHPKYGEYEIVEYRGALDITVKFKETGSLVNTNFNSAKIKYVRDVKGKSLVGVGILGGIQVYNKGKKLKSYEAWCGILKRCYDSKVQLRNPTYIGCTVCEDWKFYPNFKAWFDENYIEGYQIDKDIKYEGNRVYSPRTCMFVSHTENTLAAMSYKMYSVVVSNSQDELCLVDNQSEFCRENNINVKNFNHMIRGGRKSCMGYRLVQRLDS